MGNAGARTDQYLQEIGAGSLTFAEARMTRDETMKNRTTATIIVVVILAVFGSWYSFSTRTLTLRQVYTDVPKSVTRAEIMEVVRGGSLNTEPLRVYRHRTSRDPETVANSIRDSGFRVRQYAPFPLQTPVDWAADPHNDANWRYQLNALYPGIVYLEAYSSTGKREWFDAALELYLDWIDFNLTSDRPNKFKWYDMATGLRAMYLAVLLDHGMRTDSLEPREFELLSFAAFEHVEQLHRKQRLANSNHGLFQVAGIAALCSALPTLASCQEALPYANRGFERLFDQQFNHEGMHLEHSPEYHHLGLNVIGQLSDLGWFDLSDRHQRALENAKANFHWLVKPDTTFPALGDTGRPVYSSARRIHPTMEFLISKGEAGQRPPGGLALFPDTGYGIIRHDANENANRASAYLIMTVAHHSEVHKHADAFSFEWFDGGRSLLIDAGKWGYDDKAERDYLVSARAHNTVEINGRNDEIRKPPDRLPVLSGVHENGLYMLTANGERRPFGIQQQRILLLNPGNWLIVVDTFDQDAARYVQWFHPAEDFSCQPMEEGAAFRCRVDEMAFQVRSLVPVDAVEHHRGATEPRLQGWRSPDYRKLVAADAIGFVQEKNSSNRFAALFLLEPGSVTTVDSVSVHRDDTMASFCWKTDGRVTGVVVTDMASAQPRLQHCSD